MYIRVCGVSMCACVYISIYAHAHNHIDILCTNNTYIHNFAAVGMFKTPSPFIRISKLREDGSYAPVFKSEVKKNNPNPVFAAVKGSYLF